METHAKKGVERYCELANRTDQPIHKVSTPCLWGASVQRKRIKMIDVGWCPCIRFVEILFLSFLETQIWTIFNGEIHCFPLSESRAPANWGFINVVGKVDSISSNVNSARQEFALDLYGDYEAKIKMLLKGQSPTTRLVSRTQKVIPDLLSVRTWSNSTIQIYTMGHQEKVGDMWLHGKFQKIMKGIIFSSYLKLAISVDLTSLEIHRYSNDHRCVSLAWRRNSLRGWFFPRRVKFDSGFNVMAVYEVSWREPKVIHRFIGIWKWVVRWWKRPFWFSKKSTWMPPWIGRCRLKADVLRSWSPRVLIRPSAAGIFPFLREIFLFCIEYFRVVFWCVHRLQVLNVCNQHVTRPNSPRVKSTSEEQSR